MNALTYSYKIDVYIANYVKNTLLAFRWLLFICTREYTHECTHLISRNVFCLLQIVSKYFACILLCSIYLHSWIHSWVHLFIHTKLMCTLQIMAKTLSCIPLSIIHMHSWIYSWMHSVIHLKFNATACHVLVFSLIQLPIHFCCHLANWQIHSMHLGATLNQSNHICSMCMHGICTCCEYVWVCVSACVCSATNVIHISLFIS